MSNAFVIIKMCYVYNQQYDISCATLYIYSNEYSVYEESSKICSCLISFSCTKMDVYLFVSDHLLSSLHIYAPSCLVLYACHDSVHCHSGIIFALQPATDFRKGMMFILFQISGSWVTYKQMIFSSVRAPCDSVNTVVLFLFGI